MYYMGMGICYMSSGCACFLSVNYFEYHRSSNKNVWWVLVQLDR